MATVTIIGCLAAAVVGLTQAYKGIVGAIQAFKQAKKEKQEAAEV